MEQIYEYSEVAASEDCYGVGSDAVAQNSCY